MTLAAGPLSRIAPVSVLLQLRSTLDAADPRDLLLIGHDERRGLADTLRTWAYAADEADRLARAEAMLPSALDLFAPGSLYRGSRAAQGTDCRRGHLLTGDNVYFRNGTTFRYCKACRSALRRAARRRRMALRNSVLAQLGEHAR